MSISAGVDAISNITSDGSSLTKKTVLNLADAVPKTLKGNHPKVKRTAQRIVNSTSKMIAREGGETIVKKSFGNFLKNILKAIF